MRDLVQFGEFDAQWDARSCFYLSIDPGLCTGWAAWDRPGENKHGQLEFRLHACGVGTPPDCEKHLAIECPQVYPNQPVPPNDLITLAIQVGRYAQLALGFGSRVTTVLPHEWKGNMPKDVCAARIMKALSAEERAIVDAVKLPKTKRHNMLDAIGIGLYAFRREVKI